MLAIVFVGDPKAPLSTATTPRAPLFLTELLHFTLDQYFIILSFKQRGHFLSQPGIESWSLRPLVKTLPKIDQYIVYIYMSIISSFSRYCAI